MTFPYLNVALCPVMRGHAVTDVCVFFGQDRGVDVFTACVYSIARLYEAFIATLTCSFLAHALSLKMRTKFARGVGCITRVTGNTVRC